MTFCIRPKVLAGALGLVLLATAGCSKAGAPSDMAPPDAVASAATTAAGVPRLIDLGAGKCIPCKAMAPILENLRTEYCGRMEVQFIDVWKEPDQAVAGAAFQPLQRWLTWRSGARAVAIVRACAGVAVLAGGACFVYGAL